MKRSKILVSLFIFAMMLSLVQVVSAQDATKPVSGINWKNTTIDVGKIVQGKPVTVEFEFTNPSMVPLIIQSVRPTCGCTVADYPKEPVQPGKAAKISTTYNAATTGMFSKSIIITTNAAEGNTVLVIKGEVTPRK
jgi:hypothetical protein